MNNLDVGQKKCLLENLLAGKKVSISQNDSEQLFAIADFLSQKGRYVIWNQREGYVKVEI